MATTRRTALVRRNSHHLPDHIAEQILSLRGQRVILDADLAVLYGVSTKRLNQAVHRNLDRFPEDFMLRLTPEESKSLRSQIVTSNDGRAAGGICPTRSPSMASPCCRAF